MCVLALTGCHASPRWVLYLGDAWCPHTHNHTDTRYVKHLGCQVIYFYNNIIIVGWLLLMTYFIIHMYTFLYIWLNPGLSQDCILYFCVCLSLLLTLSVSLIPFLLPSFFCLSLSNFTSFSSSALSKLSPSPASLSQPPSRSLSLYLSISIFLSLSPPSSRSLSLHPSISLSLSLSLSLSSSLSLSPPLSGTLSQAVLKEYWWYPA